MSKQTAVEWLLEQVPRIENIASSDILDQAKAMEREQIISATYASGRTGEGYYIDTYKGGEQ